ncbi:MAG: rRNA processing protein [Icmadophila ericetorum]|nr:rRNA processing protein [Icmadophila ericetorum]
MGSSAKKKRDKKKDFQKSKLKVGKARPKATNFTDTSFKAKTITINQQSLTTTAPSLSTQFSHNLSLLTSRANSQRKDSLSYLTTTINSRPVDTPLPQPVSTILPKLLPLILDGSSGVRIHLVKLLRSLPPTDIEDFVDQILLYIRAGMTHLAADIRSSSMDVLSWALLAAEQAMVSCAGGWVKTLRCFLALLGWPFEGQKESWSSVKASLSKAGNDTAAAVKYLNSLASFLQAGLSDPENSRAGEGFAPAFPLWHNQQHQIFNQSNCFAHLNLFGLPRDEDGEMYEGCEERQKIFQDKFRTTFEKGLDSAKREGGDVGRAAGAAKKVITETMGVFREGEV